MGGGLSIVGMATQTQFPLERVQHPGWDNSFRDYTQNARVTFNPFLLNTERWKSPKNSPLTNNDHVEHYWILESTCHFIFELLNCTVDSTYLNDLKKYIVPKSYCWYSKIIIKPCETQNFLESKKFFFYNHLSK